MTPAVRDIILSNRVAWSFMGDGSRVWDFTRASDGTRVNPAGSWETIGTNGLRYDYDPTTGSVRGVLVEPARTNSIRSSAQTGAVAGTPGTSPTPGGFVTGSANSLTRTIALGTEDGIPYIDYTWSGTPSASTILSILFESSTTIAAVNAQTWTGSVSAYLSAGSLPGLAVLSLSEYSSAPAYLVQNAVPLLTSGPTLDASRQTITRTLNQATTASIVPGITIPYTIGVPVSFTLRVGGPQLELGDFVTSPIITTGSAATRAADTLSLPIPPGTYSVGVVGGTVLQAGTTYTDTVTVAGTAWGFAWPTAAVTAGERHLQRVSMRRIG